MRALTLAETPLGILTAWFELIVLILLQWEKSMKLVVDLVDSVSDSRLDMAGTKQFAKAD